MKRNYIYLLLMLCIGTLTLSSCEKDDAVKPTLTLAEGILDEITVLATATTTEVEFTCNVGWTAVLEQTIVEPVWASAENLSSKSGAKSNSITVVMNPNTDTKKDRVVTLTITYGGEEQKIVITQLKVDATIDTETVFNDETTSAMVIATITNVDAVKAPTAAETTFTVTYESNREPSVIGRPRDATATTPNVAWITSTAVEVVTKTDSKLKTWTISATITENTTGSERDAMLYVGVEEADKTFTTSPVADNGKLFEVRQAANSVVSVDAKASYLLPSKKGSVTIKFNTNERVSYDIRTLEGSNIIAGNWITAPANTRAAADGTGVFDVTENTFGSPRSVKISVSFAGGAKKEIFVSQVGTTDTEVALFPVLSVGETGLTAVNSTTLVTELLTAQKLAATPAITAANVATYLKQLTHVTIGGSPTPAEYNTIFAAGDNVITHLKLESVEIPNVSVPNPGVFSKVFLPRLDAAGGVTLSEDITTIGAFAFAEHAFTNLTWADNVSVIGESAFKGNAITTLVNTNTTGLTIGKNAFAGGTGILSTISAQGNLTINDGAFDAAVMTLSVGISAPKGALTIRKGAFNGAGIVLASAGITAKGNITIEGGAFEAVAAAIALTTITSADGSVTLGGATLAPFSTYKAGAFTISAGTTININENAFKESAAAVTGLILNSSADGTVAGKEANAFINKNAFGNSANALAAGIAGTANITIRKDAFSTATTVAIGTVNITTTVKKLLKGNITIEAGAFGVLETLAFTAITAVGNLTIGSATGTSENGLVLKKGVGVTLTLTGATGVSIGKFAFAGTDLGSVATLGIVTTAGSIAINTSAFAGATLDDNATVNITSAGVGTSTTLENQAFYLVDEIKIALLTQVAGVIKNNVFGQVDAGKLRVAGGNVGFVTSVPTYTATSFLHLTKTTKLNNVYSGFTGFVAANQTELEKQFNNVGETTKAN